MRKTFIILLFLIASCTVFSQIDSAGNYYITTHFVYGSVPAKGYKKTESRWFGGIHGGHVKVQTENYIVGFNPTNRLHIFSHRKKIHGGWASEQPPHYSLKSASFKIPVTKEQHDSLEHIIEGYLNASPYDYAFFGMRCAAAAYDLMSQIGLFKKRSKCGMTYVYFYPKLLRQEMYKKSEEKGMIITRTEGKKSRKWEKDRKKFQYPFPETETEVDSLSN